MTDRDPLICPDCDAEYYHGRVCCDLCAAADSKAADIREEHDYRTGLTVEEWNR